ncbi:putative Ig domain-containing protein, partial [Pelagicoccus sp. SDUM812005]|uniref:putative Ig domain-containing protein n=1 Tax=Pelagicoccus sp. SDUM812005 TaxID=3041257 RepID=UPI00280DA0CA
TDTFSIEVENTNDGPVATAIANQSVDEDSAFSLDAAANFSDVDAGDILTYSATLENGDPLPSWLSIDAETGRISGTPENGDVGSLSVIVSATDGQESASNTFTITVENTNDGPVAIGNISEAFVPQNATLLSEINFEDGVPSASYGSLASEDSGIVGKAADFTNAKLSVNDIDLSSESGAQTTVSMWIQGDPSGSWEMLVASDIHDLTLLDGNIGFNTGQTDLFGADASALADGQWHHVVATFTNGDVTQNSIHIDGVELSLNQIQGTPSSSHANIDSDGGTLHFGGWGHGGGYYFTGSMDEIKVYDGALSQEEIEQLRDIESTHDHWENAGLTATEDAAFSLEAADYFADIDDGDALTYSATLENGDPLPAWLSIGENNGQLSGTPENGDVGSISITITATDQSGATATQTFELEVENTNDGPTVSAEIVDQTIDEDVPFSLDVSSNFVDQDLGDTLTFSATLENGDPLPAWLSIDSATGELSGTPENGDVGTISVTVTATDGSGENVSDIFSIQVENTNDGPIATGTISSFEPQNATLLSEINFEDGVPSASYGSLASEDSGMVGKAADFTNAKLSVNDIDLSSESGAQTTVSMWIQGDPSGSWEMLVASDIHDLTLLDGNIGFNTGNSDLFGADASALADGQWHHVVATFTNGDVTQNSIHIDGVELSLGQIQGTPSSSRANIDSDGGTLHFGGWGYGGGYYFTGSMDEIKVYDGTLSQEEIEQLRDIESTHDHWENAGLTANEDATFSLDTSEGFADVDAGDVLSYAATLENGDPLPDWLAFDESTGLLSGTPENEDVGTLSVTVTATDLSGASVSDTFRIHVENTNDGPVVSAEIADQTTDEDAAFSLDVSNNFSDQDLGDTLTFSALLTDESGEPIGEGSIPSWLDFDSATGQFSGTPENEDVGTFYLKVTASDGEESASDIVSITVANTNDGPIATADSAAVTEGNTIEIDVLANDSDEDVGDSLTITDATVVGGKGAVSIVNNKLVYDPADGFPDLALDDSEDIEISYTISDGNGGTTTSTATVTVTGDDSLIHLNYSNNSYTASDNDNEIHGFGGNDSIYAGDGDDVIVGGTGYDNLYGEAGDDTFLYSEGDGADDFHGGEGNDTVKATGDDTNITIDSNFDADNSIETISADGHSGVTVTGDYSNQTLDFSATNLDGIESISGGAGNDTVIGSEGNDTILASTGNDELHGGAGDDTFLYTDGDGADDFHGGAGNDTVKATGDDTNITIDSNFDAENSIETISSDGHSGVTVTGDYSNQTLDFSATNLDGIESISGGAGNDTVIGSDGDDVILASDGYDDLHGGAGDDTFLYSEGDGADDFHGGEGNDTVKATGDDTNITIDSNFDAENSIETISSDGHSGVTVTGDYSNQTLDFSATNLDGIESISGGAGN